MRKRRSLAIAAFTLFGAACSGTDGNVLSSGTGGAGAHTSSSSTSASATASSTGATSSSASSSSGAGGSGAMLNCAAPTADCDGKESTGCEVDLSNDPANCGRCGFSCGSATCANFACQIVGPTGWVTTGDNACLTTDGVNVYWTTGRPAAMGGQVLKVPVKGGAAPEVIAPMQDGPRGIATDGTFVYWADTLAGTINKVSVNGGAVTVSASSQDAPAFIVVAGPNLYWTNRVSGKVQQQPKAGGEVVTLASGLTAPAWLAVDDLFVYWTTGDSGNSVQKAPISGAGPVTTLASGQDAPAGIAVDVDHVYWLNFKGGSLKSVGKGDQNPMTLVAGLQSPTSLVIDAANAYWTDSKATGDVAAMPLAGGALRVVAPNQKSPQCVAADKGSLYWLDTGESALNRAAK